MKGTSLAWYPTILLFVSYVKGHGIEAFPHGTLRDLGEREVICEILLIVYTQTP